MKCKRLLMAVLLFAIYGCGSSGPSVVKERELSAVRDADGKIIEAVSCSRPTGLKITLGKITCSASNCKAGATVSPGLSVLLKLAGAPSFEGIGDGLKDMFANSLHSVGCFRILDREATAAIENELRLTGNVSAAGMEAADYIIMGAVTSINFEHKNGYFGWGLIPIIGAVNSTKENATLAMDIRMVDVKTGEIVYARTYEAASGKTGYGIGGFGTGGVSFGGSLNGLNGTAMEEVARNVIIRATHDIVDRLAPHDLIVHMAY